MIFLVRSVLYGLRGNKRGRDVDIKSYDDKRTVFKDELVNDIFLPFFFPICHSVICKYFTEANNTLLKVSPS